MSAVAANVELAPAEHRRLLARFFMESHVEYVPETIRWPALEQAGRARLVGLPFWQEAVSTENVTSHTVTAAAQLEPDPQLREAIELQGFEENRHARLLSALTAHYGIPIQEPPRYVPRSLEDDFLFAGYGECFDSFFAFGLFALARESGFFPPALVSIFEPVMQEEARHILFFVNWVHHRRLRLPWWKRPGFRLRCAWIILRHVASRIRTARSMGAQATQGAREPVGQPAARADNFTLSGSQQFGGAVTLHRLLQLCLQENERRLGGYDAKLLRPTLVPGLGRFFYRLLPASI
jgi:hypothetical protein